MSASLVLSCEHASARVPTGIDLQLPPEVFTSHRAWDEGALPLAQRLAAKTGAPLFAGGVTRLVVDLNRKPETAIPELSFGMPVPANQGLSEEARRMRLERFHRPHREAVEARCRAHPPCVHLSIHSFVPELHGQRRELEVGVLFDPHRRWETEIADRFLEGLLARNWDVRANEPYTGWADGLTTWLRPQFAPRSYAGLEIEMAQALDTERREQLAHDLAWVCKQL